MYEEVVCPVATCAVRNGFAFARTPGARAHCCDPYIGGVGLRIPHLFAYFSGGTWGLMTACHITRTTTTESFTTQLRSRPELYYPYSRRAKNFMQTYALGLADAYAPGNTPSEEDG